MNWINKLFRKAIDNAIKEIHTERIVYEIKQTKITMPKDDEIIIFQFPHTPEGVIKEFERCLIEFQNSNRKFITIGGNIEILAKRSKRKDLEVENGESNQTAGHQEPKGER